MSTKGMIETATSIFDGTTLFPVLTPISTSWITWVYRITVSQLILTHLSNPPLGEKYDYLSIMHYESNEGSKNGHNTIEAKVSLSKIYKPCSKPLGWKIYADHGEEHGFLDVRHTAYQSNVQLLQYGSVSSSRLDSIEWTLCTFIMLVVSRRLQSCMRASLDMFTSKKSKLLLLHAMS